MKKIVAWLSIVALVLCMSGGSALAGEPPKVHLLSVVFGSNEIPGTWENDVAALGGKVVSTVPELGFSQIQATAKALKGLKQLPYVEALNPAIEWRLPDEQAIEADAASSFTDRYWWGLQWDIKRVTQDGASYELGKGSRDVVVGILDTGINAQHVDLKNNLLSGSKNFVPAGYGAGESGDPSAYQDRHGHGSHVAGSIAGNGNMLGVAPNAGIRAYRVLNANGSGPSSAILQGIVAAANDGCDVISMSLGGVYIHGQAWWTDPETGERTRLGNDVADYVAYMRAMKYATDRGSLVVASAGNDALNCTTKPTATDLLNAEYGPEGYEFVGAGFKSPAIIPGVLCVSATGPNDIIATYSNYGPGFIQVAAPGGDSRLWDQYEAEGRLSEYMARKLYQSEFCLSANSKGSAGYTWMIGTSMAAPKVSGVAALLVDKYGKMHPKELTSLLLKQAVDPVKGNDTWFFGAGHLNAYKALGGK
ncbi:MAG: S8 family peptidase [Bacillota bacterium]